MEQPVIVTAQAMYERTAFERFREALHGFLFGEIFHQECVICHKGQKSLASPVVFAIFQLDAANKWPGTGISGVVLSSMLLVESMEFCVVPSEWAGMNSQSPNRSVVRVDATCKCALVRSSCSTKEEHR